MDFGPCVSSADERASRLGSRIVFEEGEWTLERGAGAESCPEIKPRAKKSLGQLGRWWGVEFTCPCPCLILDAINSQRLVIQDLPLIQYSVGLQPIANRPLVVLS
jgi:hypothetical protein